MRFRGCPKTAMRASHDIEIRRRDAVTLRPETALILNELQNAPWPPPAMNDASPGGDGGWRRHWLPKRGDPRQWGGPAEPSVSAMAYKRNPRTAA